MRRGYTLIEIIITIAITGILSVGMFKAFEAITTRSEKAKILSTLSIDSQSALNQISLLLYNRAPMSVQGCTDNTSVSCVPLDQATNATILQWYATASESYQKGNYSGFVDMNRSINPNLYTPYSDFTQIKTTQVDKWGNFNWSNNDVALVFAGAFEEGERIEPYKITMTTNDTIIFSDALDKPSKIYEKYYLVDSAYAVTRRKDAKNLCGTKIDNFKDDNDLLLFYNYRPWNSQTFCDGNVSLLARNVNAFAAHQINGTIRLGIDMNSSVGNNKINPVRLSKQKVVF